MYKFSFVIVIGLLFLSSCKKKDIQPRKSVYENFTWTASPCVEENTGGITIDFTEGVNFRYPVFNPRNETEFIYYEYTCDSLTAVYSNPKLVKYSLLTKEKTVLLTGKFLSGQVAWNKKGELAFIESTAGAIYTMNDDGTNLQFQFIASSPSLSHVSWSPDGDVFYSLFTKIINVNNRVDYLLRKKPGLANIDTLLLDNPIYSMDISSKNQLLNFTGNGYYEITSLSVDTLTAAVSQVEPGMFFNHGLAYNKSGNKFYVSATKYYGAGVYEVDINQNTVKKVFNGCKDGYVQGLSLSPNENYLIMEKRGIMESIFPYEIWILDLNQKKETRVIGL
ncbi:MAG: hypothetical protein PHQ74_08010 [Crocinitomicaceae bacterium]|nr:hypothetical protein [Crocinitomicaceae bacterium]